MNVSPGPGQGPAGEGGAGGGIGVQYMAAVQWQRAEQSSGEQGREGDRLKLHQPREDAQGIERVEFSNDGGVLSDSLR